MSIHDAGYDAEIKRRQPVAEANQAQPITSTAAQQAADKSVTVFDAKNAEESAKNLGLTTEQYLEIINNPEFMNLSPEEKVEYINKFKAAQNAAPTMQVEQNEQVAQTTQAEQKAQAEPVVEAAQAEVVAAAEAPITAKAQTVSSASDEDSVFDEVAEAQTVEEFVEPDTKKKDVKTYDFNKFDNIQDNKEFVNVYAEEYAKNKFLFEDKNKKTIDDWNNLTKEEQKKLIDAAKKEVKKEFELKSKLMWSWNNYGSRRDLIAKEMRYLQTANNLGMSLKTLKLSHTQGYQEKLLNDYLKQLSEVAPEKISDRDKYSIIKYDTTLKALNAALQKQGHDNECFLYDKALEEAKKHGITVAEAIKEYLKEQDPDELSPEQKVMLKFMERLDAKHLNRFGVGKPTDDKLYQELLHGYRKTINKSHITSSQGQMSLVTDKVFDKYKNKPECLMALYDEAIETGNVYLIRMMLDKAERCPEFQKMLAESRDLDVMQVNSDNAACLGDKCDIYTKNLSGCYEIASKAGAAVGCGIKNLTKMMENTTKSMSDEQYEKNPEAVRNLTGHSAEIDTVIVDEAITRSEKAQLNMLRAVGEKGTVEGKCHGVKKTPEMHRNNQIEILDKLTESTPEATKVLVEENIIPQLHSDNQVEAHAIAQKRVEEQFDEKEAIELEKQLTDQIAECDVKNQLAMHRTTLNSKYDEVKEYAAYNVPNLDKSVQADAIKAVYETGNTKAIEAVNTQLSKCDAAAVQSVAKEVALQVAAMEERHTQIVTGNIAEKLVLMDAAKDPASADKWSVETHQQKLAHYREQFAKATPIEKFRMISKLQGVWQKEVIGHIATYCPELLSSLISSMGADLFQLQLSPEVRNKIMLEMLRVPDLQADALEFFKDNPNGFGSGVKSICAELLLERKDASVESQVIKNALPASAHFSSKPDSLTVEGNVYDNSEELSFWKRDKLGRLIG